jgi:hypothetical protein
MLRKSRPPTSPFQWSANSIQNCGEQGHLSRDCPSEPSQERICYKCKTDSLLIIVMPLTVNFRQAARTLAVRLPQLDDSALLSDEPYFPFFLFQFTKTWSHGHSAV